MSKIGGAVGFGSIVAAIAGAVLLLPLGVTTTSAAARRATVGTGFDGMWSVSIITQSGPCDASYRYPARIFRGRVLQAENDFSYQLVGAVDRNGAIRVTVSKGGQSATGFGRLHGWRGGGVWRADGGMCSGVWSALRRF